VATWDDVRRAALALPGTVEDTAGHDGTMAWKVDGKLFVWERPLRKSDLAALGDGAPTGPILGARVPDEGAKWALCETEPEIFFTTPHFTGYPAVLLRLDVIGVDELTEVIHEAWRARAPKRLL
jgi:hypothetical protein